MKERKKPIHPYLVKLGSEIKKLRLQKDLSLEIIGSHIGLDASNLQKIENGQNLTLNTLLKLCICLDIHPAKLVDKITWDLKEEDIDLLTTLRPKKKKIKKPSKKG